MCPAGFWQFVGLRPCSLFMFFVKRPWVIWKALYKLKLLLLLLYPNSGLTTSVFRGCGKTTERTDVLTISKRSEVKPLETFWNRLLVKCPNSKLLYNVFKVILIDRIKLCHYIPNLLLQRVGYCISSSHNRGIDYLSNVKSLSVKKVAKPLQAVVDRKSQGNGAGGFVYLSTASNKDCAMLLFLVIMSGKKDRLVFLKTIL